MIHLHDRATMASAPDLDLDPRVRRLLVGRIAALSDDLVDHTEYLVVQPGDTEDDVVRHVGLSPLVEPYRGARFGEAGFWLHWDLLLSHDGCWELVFTFGSAFACVVMVQDADGVPEELRALCKNYSGDWN